MLTMERTALIAAQEGSVSIATLLSPQLEAAVGILAGAFGGSPLARHCFADQGAYYDRAVRAYARLSCARRAAAGGAHLGAYHDERLVGTAGITPPVPGPLPDAIRARWAWFVAIVGPHAAGRIAEVERAIARHRPAVPHVALDALGVLPDARGRGAGRALLGAADEYAAAYPTAAGVYAVAASPEGVAFHARAGFGIVGREELHGLTLSCLFRPRDVNSPPRASDVVAGDTSESSGSPWEDAMAVQMRPASADDTEAIVRLSLRAWAPVFASMRETLGPSAYAIAYPDWQRQQRETVEQACGDVGNTIVWVAEADGAIVGFVAYTLDAATQMGTVELLAVAAAFQGRGVATALNHLALDAMRAGGMTLAGLSTGGDPGHAPARRAYERAGYRPFPTVWYYQEL